MRKAQPPRYGNLIDAQCSPADRARKEESKETELTAIGHVLTKMHSETLRFCLGLTHPSCPFTRLLVLGKLSRQSNLAVQGRVERVHWCIYFASDPFLSLREFFSDQCACFCIVHVAPANRSVMANVASDFHQQQLAVRCCVCGRKRDVGRALI